MMKRFRWAGLAVLVMIIALPPQWYPEAVRKQWTKWFGADAHRTLPSSIPFNPSEAEPACPEDPQGWRGAFVIDGVEIAPSAACVADNPHAVAAFVRGTNNVSAETLARSGLAADAVEKGRDLDGDGDPDEIHIRLEVAELNGASMLIDRPVTKYAIAPGITPGMWVFAPKLIGMAVENIDTSQRMDPTARSPRPPAA